MIKDITLGQYIPGNSILHKADPRIKIVLLFALMIMVFLTRSVLGFVIYTAFTLLMVIASGVPVRYTLKGLKPVFIFIVIAAIINIFTIPGTEVFALWKLTVTYEGLVAAAKMAMTLSLVIVIGSMLTLTTTPISLTDGLEKLMHPLKAIKVPVHEIAMMMSIALRFIPTLLEETDKIMKAQAARGADFDTGNLVQKAKSFIPVLVPLFVSAFRRAEQLATAMEARCYRGSEGRTKLRQLKLTRMDYLLVMSAAVFFLIFIYVRV